MVSLIIQLVRCVFGGRSLERFILSSEITMDLDTRYKGSQRLHKFVWIMMHFAVDVVKKRTLQIFCASLKY